MHMNSFRSTLSILVISVLTSCTSNQAEFDASGTFEAVETIISAEASGVVHEFQIVEGQELTAGQWIGYIDSTQLYLKKQQLEAQILALQTRRPDISVQLSALREQLKAAEREQIRIQNLVKNDAATSKQLDDINAQISVIKSQIEAQRSTLGTTDLGIQKDAHPLNIQVAQLNDQLLKCKIINPIKGTVLAKYTEVYESTAPGKPLYKIADLSTITLKAYITGDQLPLVKLNQPVRVLTDDGKDGFAQQEGQITWISSKAEFTPKSIQTKAERADKVYAIKIQVPNDGSYKIGMYGEVKF